MQGAARQGGGDVREYPETGAFLLECTEMPPYAYLIQAATQCRVYDFITMLNWVHSGLCRRLKQGGESHGHE